MTLNIEAKAKQTDRSAATWSQTCEYLIILITTLSRPVGDAAVGKTSLTQMFHSDGMLFQKNYSMVRALCSSILQIYTYTTYHAVQIIGSPSL